jgi:hypothetical protein
LNWYAHAVLAERRSSDPLCVLGAMLPDFASALRLRVAAPADREGALAAGLRLHGETDARFHLDPGFLALQAAGRTHLEAAGVPRGTARAAAHVGIELALDGWLAHRAPRSRAFGAALEAADSLAERPALFRGAFDPARGLALAARLREGDLPEAWTTPARCAQSVERTLAARPRLALAPGARDAVAGWLHALAPSLEARAPELLARWGA